MLTCKNLILRYILLLMLLLTAANAHAQLEFAGVDKQAVKFQPEASTGLEAIYVLERTQGVRVSFNSSQHGNWRRYMVSGAQATEVSSSNSVTLESGSAGYIFNDGTRDHCYWIVDYSESPYRCDGLTVSQESTCDRLVLNFAGNAASIKYHTITGVPKVLSRDIRASYNTLEWSEDVAAYVSVEVAKTFESLTSTLSVPAPLCGTSLVLEGDAIQAQWGEATTHDTGWIDPMGIEAHTWAAVTPHDADNEIRRDSGDELSGSAPLEVNFVAVPTDAVVWHEWQVSRDEMFDIIDLRFGDNEFSTTFNDYGTFYVRYQCADRDGNCTWESDVYRVNIGESKLLCPNAFSPGNQDGVNDQWKVSYRSLVKYECHIFNRWGKQLFTSHDPSQGWNGMQGGKPVPDGVYFYVIKATGADGIRYNLSGDINVISCTRSQIQHTTQ